jgi:hypothetical protein
MKVSTSDALIRLVAERRLPAMYSSLRGGINSHTLDK